MVDNLNEIIAFVTIAQEKSFTKAAAKLRVSQSALSHSLRSLEEKLGLRLLHRTTRSVSTTEAGDRILVSIAPLIEQIGGELNALNELSEIPSGNIRLTMAEYPANNLLLPKLDAFLKKYPKINIEISVDYKLIDIVKERFDAGIRLGENLEKDMVAIPISPMVRMFVVGSPKYFENRPKPIHPHDLLQHNCINIRLPTRSELYRWEFEKDGQELKVKTEGQLTMNRIDIILKAAKEGIGLAYAHEKEIQAELASGELVTVLEDWTPPFSGYHLYFPTKRQQSPAFKLLIDALRYD